MAIFETCPSTDAFTPTAPQQIPTREYRKLPNSTNQGCHWKCQRPKHLCAILSAVTSVAPTGKHTGTFQQIFMSLSQEAKL